MSNTMEYKEYIAKVEYSSEDKCFFGKLEMIEDLVTFEATNVEELEKNFQTCVEEYLQTCEELGREPQKAYKEAIKAGVSLNSFVSRVLASQVKKIAV